MAAARLERRTARHEPAEPRQVDGVAVLRHFDSLAATVEQSVRTDIPLNRVPDLLRLVLTNEAAATAAPALSSMLIYMLMAAVLVFRPEGLFPAANK